MARAAGKFFEGMFPFSHRISKVNGPRSGKFFTAIRQYLLFTIWAAIIHAKRKILRRIRQYLKYSLIAIWPCGLVIYAQKITRQFFTRAAGIYFKVCAFVLKGLLSKLPALREFFQVYAFFLTKFTNKLPAQRQIAF